MNALTLKMTAISALMLSSTAVVAAPNMDIKVVGEVIAPACEVILPPGGLVADYGNRITPSLIDLNRPVSLGEKMGSRLVVRCDAQTPLSFGLTDNRVGTASESGSQYFGLGNVNGTGKLGYYTIRAFAPHVDARPARLTLTGGVASSDVKLEQGKRASWTSGGNDEVAKGREFALYLVVEAFLAKKGDMHGGVGEDTRLDGSTTLDFGFGV